MRTSNVIGTVFALAMFIPTVASAHVTINTEKALPASYETFSLSVPNEKESPVTTVRVAIPDGITSVTPTVKQGWSIATKEADGKVTEITWSAGLIPSGQRDDFSFSAKTPATKGTLAWKAYQTYADGETVAWDETPAADHHDDDAAEVAHPYSETMIVGSLDDTRSAMAFAFSIAALAIAALGFVMGARRK